jgi:hypothetical protein
MKNGRRNRPPVDLFEASLATGIGQALAGWAAEYTHNLIESDPELRNRLRQNWLFIFERIAQGLREPEPLVNGGDRNAEVSCLGVSTDYSMTDHSITFD